MHKVKKYGKIKKNNEEGEKIKMVETIKIKEKNRMKKLEKIAETRMAVYIYIYIYIYRILSFRK